MFPLRTWVQVVDAASILGMIPESRAGEGRVDGEGGVDWQEGKASEDGVLWLLLWWALDATIL